MASSRGGYEGGGGAGGKIRRRAPPRAPAASPYARPPAAARSVAGGGGGGEGAGWLSRLVDPASRFLASSATRLFSSVFGKQAPPPPALLAAPPSPPPPALEEGLPEGEENCQVTIVNLPSENLDTSVKDGDDKINCSDDNGVIELEELLKQKTFTRAEFERLAELLRSRTIESDALKLVVNNDVKEIHPSGGEKETRGSKLPVDFSIITGNVADPAASPAELAKAYMGSRSSKGSPLCLRLHNPASLPVKSAEANTAQTAKPSALSLVPSSSIHASTLSDHFESSYKTPRRSAIYRMSSSPYFKSAVSSRDVSGIASSSYQTPSSVHTFGRQVLKRKSTVLTNESVPVGPIRRMRQRYNMMSPLLETRPGHRGYLASHATKLDEDVVQHSAPIQKRPCLNIVDVGTQGMQTKGGVDNRVCNNSFGHAPPQSTEMATKILKQLDTLVPSQKEGGLELKARHGNVMGIENHLSQKKEGLVQGNLSELSASGVKVASGVNNINDAATFTRTAKDDKSVDAILNNSAVLTSKKPDFQITSPKSLLELADPNKSLKDFSHQANNKIEKSELVTSEHSARNSGITNKEKPPRFSSRGLVPSSLILSNEVDRNKMLASSNGFTFPVPDALSVDSQAPPTPTMASPPILSVEKQQSCLSAASDTPSAAVESVPRTAKSVSEGPIADRCGKKSKAEGSSNLSKGSSSEVPSSASPSVFSFANSESTTLSNGSAYTSGSSASTVIPSNGPVSSFFSSNAGSSTTSSAHHSFQFCSGPSVSSQTVATPPLQKSDSIQVEANPIRAASFGTQNGSIGGTFTFSNTGTGSSLASSNMFASTASQSVTAPSLASAGAGSSSAPFSFSTQPGGAGSLVAHDKSKETSTESAFGARLAESGNGTSQFPQSSASHFSSLSSTTFNLGSSSSFANPPFGSAPSGSSPLNLSSVFSFSTGTGSSSSVTSSSTLPVMNSGFGSNSGLSPSPIFGTNLATTASPSFGMPSTASVSSPFTFVSSPSPVFSLTPATPTTLPNPSPANPLFGAQNPSVGFSMGTDQMNVEHNMNGDKNQSPFSTVPSFGLPTSSPVTPIFSSLATQSGTSTTSGMPGIFQFGQQNPVPSGGGFSLGTGGGDDKSSRRIFKVRRRK